MKRIFLFMLMLLTLSVSAQPSKVNRLTQRSEKRLIKWWEEEFSGVHNVNLLTHDNNLTIQLTVYNSDVKLHYIEMIGMYFCAEYLNKHYNSFIRTAYNKIFVSFYDGYGTLIGGAVCNISDNSQVETVFEFDEKFNKFYIYMPFGTSEAIY